MPGARDGQLRVRRGTDSPPWALQMFDDDLGLWLTLAQADEEEDAMRAGIPILRGPYVVDFSDIPHDGDTMTLWTPQVGDVLLAVGVDWASVVQWDVGTLFLHHDAAFDHTTQHSLISLAEAGNIATGATNGDLMMLGGQSSYVNNGSGTNVAGMLRFGDTVPVQVTLGDTPGVDPSAGHCALYALVARAVTP